MWFQLTIFIGVAVASHFVVKRFGQPMVIAEIILGVIIGPSVIGIITGNNFLITPFAQIGAIFLLFAIGLECNINEIYTPKSIVIATCGIIVPWIAGFLFGVALGQPLGVAVFIGAILVSTSTAVTAEILVELGQVDTQVGKTIIGAAVVDDILGFIVLAFAIGVSGETFSMPHIFLLGLAAALFVVIGGFIGSRYLGRLVSWIETRTNRMQHSAFLFALTIMFLYVFISETIGLSVIIGAFVAGTMFSSIPEKKELDDGAKFLSTIFTPIFFISVGIMVDLREITSINVLLLGILLTLIAILTKVIGCSLPVKAMGMSTNDSLAVGYGMTPRCELAVIIGLAGLSAGIITQDIYVMAVLVSILTTVVSAPFFRMILKKGKKSKSKDELIKSMHKKKRG